jgi:hypothetical protein
MDEQNQEQELDFELIEGEPGESTIQDYEDNDLPLVDSVRERRREERQQRKQRRTQAIERDKTEINFLRTRNDSLERRLNDIENRTKQQDLHLLDKTLQDAQTEVQAAERVMAQAWNNQNGDEAAQALKFRDQAAQKVQQLQELKSRASQQQSKPSAPPEVVNHVQEFMKDHPWYNPNTGDEDSLIVHALDASIARSGKDPRTEEYWDELRDKIAQRLPHKVGKPVSTQQRGGPVISGSRDHVPSSSKQEVYISPERKAAMVEAGVWDDPVLRKRYVQRYMSYDREHQLNNRR